MFDFDKRYATSIRNNPKQLIINTLHVKYKMIKPHKPSQHGTVLIILGIKRSDIKTYIVLIGYIIFKTLQTTRHWLLTSQ